MDQLIIWIMARVLSHNHDPYMILGQNMDRGHVTIRVPEFIFWPKKKVSITGEDIGLLP